ncbi:hypothetical protein ACFVIY_42050 [Streptomyces sp. NPDC127166]|uniref:hypothetical protein n=1 Tax=Streptomyces sp. NPDC127166 TaxID=3345380 RepID=UPI003639F0F7
MSDRQTFIARSEAVLRRADDLVAKTNARSHHNLNPRELDQVERDRQEAGLLIQSAAVWARLAAVSPLLGPSARSGKAAAGQAVMDQASQDTDLSLEDTSGERGGPNPLAWP